jgi:hypothetical protein
MIKYNYDNTPNPSRFLDSYRFLGYSNYSAIADLVDNSFDAEADSVWISTQKKGDDFTISVADDGCGMDERVLQQAYRLGAITEHDPERDLGKFGVGSASASLSIARKTTVITKSSKSPCLVKIIDLDHMVATNTFAVHMGKAGTLDADMLADTLEDAPTGTLVRLEKCDNIRSKSNLTQFNNQLRKHLGQTFRIFLAAGKRIYINGKLIAPIDPMLLDGFTYATDRYQSRVFSDDVYALRISENGATKEEKIRIRIVLLPNIDKKLWDERWPRDVPKPSQQGQGFYVLRNNREIAEAERLELFVKHNDYNRFRAEIFFNASLDSHMGVNFTKRRLDVSQSLFDQLQAYLKPQLDTVRKVLNRERTVKEQEVTDSFRESEAIIERKKKLLVKRKQTEDEIKREIEATRKRQPEKTPEQIEEEQKRFLDEAGKPKDCHFDQINLGRTGSFFETERIGHTLVIKYNMDHPFYQKFYSEKDRATQNDLNFLLYSFVLAKRNLEPEQEAMMEQIEGIWSLNLKALLD